MQREYDEKQDSFHAYFQLLTDILDGKLIHGNKAAYVIDNFPIIDVPKSELITDEENTDILVTVNPYDSLFIAIWCFTFTDNYNECMSVAHNLDDPMNHVVQAAGSLAYIYEKVRNGRK